MADFSFLKELGKDLFLRATSDPSIRSAWNCYEISTAERLSDLMYVDDEEQFRRRVISGLHEPFELPSPSLITPLILYFFQEWVDVATS
jgi:hypothetical protein